MMHMYAQYGHIITNYALILAITLVIWPESQETSNEIGHFVKVFWDIINIPSLIFFLLTMSHNITPREGFALDHFFIFYARFKLSSNFVEQPAWRFLARDRASLNLHWIFDKIAYCEPKNYFCKKTWVSDDVPVVHIWPTSCRFTRNLSFFTRGGRKGFGSPYWDIVHIRWYSIFVKCGGSILK